RLRQRERAAESDRGERVARGADEVHPSVRPRRVAPRRSLLDLGRAGGFARDAVRRRVAARRQRWVSQQDGARARVLRAIAAGDFRCLARAGRAVPRQSRRRERLRGLLPEGIFPVTKRIALALVATVVACAVSPEASPPAPTPSSSDAGT